MIENKLVLVLIPGPALEFKFNPFHDNFTLNWR